MAARIRGCRKLGPICRKKGLVLPKGIVHIGVRPHHSPDPRPEAHAMSRTKKILVLFALLAAPSLMSACADSTGPRPSLDTVCEAQGAYNRCP